MEMVIRQTPPSMPAAPMSAKPPGDTRPPGESNESIRRPREAPIIMHGTKRPEGRGKPYVRSANVKEKEKKRSVTGGVKRVGSVVPGTFSRWKSSLTAPL